MNLPRFLHPTFILTLGLAVPIAACRPQPAAPPPPPPPEVSVVAAAIEPVQITTELPGRISPVREAQVRARATGILLKRLFEEGAVVREGQVLFEIDPVPLQAALDAANAARARTEAALKESRSRVQRYEELVKINAISRQVHDEAVAALGQNEAELLSTAAAVRTAELNLGYARVLAPISGRIGKALVTEGALVSATEATQLAVIRQLDPVYFDFTQSSTEVLRLRRALAQGTLQGVTESQSALTLLLDDGTRYPHPGRVLFSDIAVDPTTGMITLRAVVPNPDGILLPGLFARAMVVEGIKTNALVIPLRTVVRGPAGASTVLVVNAQDKVEARTIEIDRVVGNRVLVSKGLASGDRVLVEGSQKAPPGAPVRPVPFNPSASVSPGGSN